MKLRGAVLGLVLGVGLGGCGIFSVPQVEPFQGVAVREALVRARDGNWRVRASAGAVRAEGLVSFVSDSTANIGDARVRLAQIDSLHRRANTDLGGKRAGALAGGLAGVAIGAVYRSFFEWGSEHSCDQACTLGIYVPSVVITGLLGAVIGAVIQPPHSEWLPIWRR